MNDDLKQATMKKTRFAALTKTFYDPEGTVTHQRQLDRDKLKSSQEQRVGTPSKDDQPAAEKQPEGPKYYPLAPESWKKPLVELRQNSILKHPRVLQTLFYMLGYTRDEICERGTNALDFKLLKDLINESLFQKMGNYKPEGQRDGAYKEYQKMSFLKSNMKDIDEEKVEDFSLVLGKVMKWISLALEIRCEDIVNRRDIVEYNK